MAARAALPKAEKLINKLASVQAAIGALKQLANDLSADDLLAAEQVLSAAVAEFNDLKADLGNKIGHKLKPLKKRPIRRRETRRRNLFVRRQLSGTLPESWLS